MVDVSELRVTPENRKLKVQKAMDGQLITRKILVIPTVLNHNVVSDIQGDVLKMVVKNRYNDIPPAVGFVSGFGLKKGAIGSSVAHDSHNIIAVGTDDHSIAEALNRIVESKGGISLIGDRNSQVLPLPVAGIMSKDDGYTVASTYESMNSAVKELGSSLISPFMTLSFMALLVIPELKLSDKGLFDATRFDLTGIYD